MLSFVRGVQVPSSPVKRETGRKRGHGRSGSTQVKMDDWKGESGYLWWCHEVGGPPGGTTFRTVKVSRS